MAIPEPAKPIRGGGGDLPPFNSSHMAVASLFLTGLRPLVSP